MESLSPKHAVSASLFLKRTKLNRKTPFANNIIKRSRFCSTRRSLSLSIRSKQFHFRDRQDYSKPSRLLQAEEPKVCNDNREEYSNDASKSVYKIDLCTSRFSGSGLSDLNAGVLLCLIAENGDSILLRIPVILVSDQCSGSEIETLRFQRGSIDEFTFKGPRLGRLKALWIGLESGRWRLGKLSLTVISSCPRQQISAEDKLEEEVEAAKFIGVKYDFQEEDIQIGEGSYVSMLELRPCLVAELSDVDPSDMFRRSPFESTSLETQQILNKQSMKEYSNLKLSLLLYDAMLVLIGASALSFSVGEHRALAFMAGGVAGFSYLFLLQKSVDGISSPEKSGTIGGVLKGFKGPISSIALALGLSLLAIKHLGSRDISVAITAEDLVLGAMGFLVCKVSVVLAALKPVSKRF